MPVIRFLVDGTGNKGVLIPHYRRGNRMRGTTCLAAAAAVFVGATTGALGAGPPGLPAVSLHQHFLHTPGTTAEPGQAFCANPELFGTSGDLNAVFAHYHYTIHSGAPGAATLGGNADQAFLNPNNPVSITAIGC